MEKEFTKIVAFSMTETDYKQLADDYQGLCMVCGSTKDSCEPDAEHYECGCCEEKAVFGIEQLVIMGKIQIGSDDDFYSLTGRFQAKMQGKGHDYEYFIKNMGGYLALGR
jgi:hypothetical protein